MKDFWLAILKNIVTYVLMIIILIVGGITVVTQKFPPEWGQIRTAVTTIKDGYVSMIKMRQSMGAPQTLQTAMPDPAALLAQMEDATSDHQAAPPKKPKDKAEIEMQTTLALLKSVSQQMQPQSPAPSAANEDELQRNVLILVKQNHDMIERMNKIQTYLAGLNQYLVQLVPRQPIHHSAVQQPPPPRQPSTVAQPIPTGVVPAAATTATPAPVQNAKQ